MLARLNQSWKVRTTELARQQSSAIPLHAMRSCPIPHHNQTMMRRPQSDIDAQTRTGSHSTAMRTRAYLLHHLRTPCHGYRGHFLPFTRDGYCSSRKSTLLCWKMMYCFAPSAISAVLQLVRHVQRSGLMNSIYGCASISPPTPRLCTAPRLVTT